MDIQAVRVRIGDDDVALLLKKLPLADLPVRNPTVRLTAEGVLVGGTYATVLLPVPFQMLWRLSVAEGKIRASLIDLDFYGVPAGPLRGLVLGLVQEEVARLPGTTLEGETVVADLGTLLTSLGVPVTITPRAIHHEAGALVFEAKEEG